MSTQTATPQTGKARYREEVLPELVRLMWKQVGRMLLGVPLIAMVFLQISLASEVLEEQTIQELTNLITFYGFTIGVYDIVGHMILAWMLIPTLQILEFVSRELYREVRA